MKPIIISIMLMLLSTLQTAMALEIKNVQHSVNRFLPVKSETVSIRFNLSEKADVVLNIYDGRDFLIRSISSKKTLSAGDQGFVWDGNDQAGRVVPPEAYHYTLVAKDLNGDTVEYDITDLTGGKELAPRQVKWNQKAKHISYVLTKPARVSIRIGLKDDGPLLGTLIDWVPRNTGLHEEKWDGMDDFSVLDIAKHPKLLIQAQAFELSKNTILVGPSTKEVELIKELTWGSQKRTNKHKRKQHNLHELYLQPIENRKDARLQMYFPENIKRNSAGLPIITGKTPIRVDVDDKDRAMAVSRRYEMSFYFDGRYLEEAEVGFLPMTWQWDPIGVNAGEHYITVNYLGYKGNFGVATAKVVVSKSTLAAEKK